MYEKVFKMPINNEGDKFNSSTEKIKTILYRGLILLYLIGGIYLVFINYFNETFLHFWFKENISKELAIINVIILGGISIFLIFYSHKFKYYLALCYSLFIIVLILGTFLSASLQKNFLSLIVLIIFGLIYSYLKSRGN